MFWDEDLCQTLINMQTMHFILSYNNGLVQVPDAFCVVLKMFNGPEDQARRLTIALL